jgi:TetR/AcrR family transcriptional repressor of nem operon
MIAVVALLAPAMSGTPQEQERQAWTLVASIVGAITIARALPPGDEAQAVLDAVLASAMKVVTDVGGTLADPGFS